MNYHELFSEDGSTCLYCQAGCSFFAGEGEVKTLLPKLYFIDTYTCNYCAEKFFVHYTYPDNTIVGFGFTCNDLLAKHLYRKETIELQQWVDGGSVVIPAFDYSFADKDELYQRLTTMAVFA